MRGLLDSLQWVSINAYDAKGNLLGVVNLAEDQLEEDDDSPPLSGHLAQMLKAQELVLRMMGTQNERLLKSAVDMVEASAERTVALERQVARLLDEIQALIRGQLSQADDSELESLIRPIVASAMQNGMKQ